MIYDRAMTALMHCFLSGGVTIGEVGLIVLSFWCLFSCYKKYITVAGVFFYIILLIFLAVCIRNATRALHCCKGWV
jgi:hypothetical protein